MRTIALKEKQINEDKVAFALERLNKERINIINDPLLKDMQRKQHLLGEVKKFEIKELFNHFATRFLRKQINAIPANENFPLSKERLLARATKGDVRVVVYTCITGNYDTPKSPLFNFSSSDYILFSDYKCETLGWENILIPNEIKKEYNESLTNRYIKFHPFNFFKGRYDYSIYIDGNITPVSDLGVLCELVTKDIGLAFHKHCSRDDIYDEIIACKNNHKGDFALLKKQVDDYYKKGFPKNYGMVEGNVIVTDLNNPTAKCLLDGCWKELLKYKAGRDQIIWPYVLWKENIIIDKVATLGNNVWINPKFEIHEHA